VFALFAVLAVAVFVRILYVQIAQADRWKEYAVKIEQRIQDITPARGQIYSTDGSLLATSVPIYNLYWDSKAEGLKQDYLNQELDSLCMGLSRILGAQSAAYYKRDLLEARRLGRRYHPIHKKLSFTQMKELVKLPLMRRGANKSGFIFRQEEIRKKPFNQLASRTIGIDRETARVGLEEAYNDELAGQVGKQMMERIAGNVWKPASNEFIVVPREGIDIVSTIDIHLQDVAHTALERQLKQHNAAWGTVILMEVETGYIRAVSNLERDETIGHYYETYNYAIGETVEPGSTFKLASILALLDEGLVSLTDSIDRGQGVTEFYGRKMHDSDADEITESVLCVADVFAKSSNVGTALLVQKHFGSKPQLFLDKLNAFGLNESLGIRLKGENAPRIYKKVGDKNWSGLSLTQMSIGYEVLQTPLQTLAFYNAIANGGRLLQPQFVEAYRRNGQTVDRAEPIVLKERVCKKSTIEAARSMMERTCLPGGTADYIFEKTSYKVAGKTGTARIAYPGGYYPNRYRASFVGYFPAEAPKYSCLVVVNDTKSGVYYGSSVAAPVFRELANKIYATVPEMSDYQQSQLAEEAKLPTSRNGVREHLERVYAGLGIKLDQNAEGNWVKTATGETSVALTDLAVAEGSVPDVRGMGLRDALQLLENSGLRVRVTGNGTVRRQSIEPGTAVSRGREIRIELS
jgi:cell division protein FtsI (penicillin-binding protein 3)